MTHTREVRKPLIIGIGQQLRGDDALGWRIAEMFASRYPTVVEVLLTTQLAPEQAEVIARAAAAVFVDARIDTSPGIVQIQSLIAKSSTRLSISHVVGPTELLAYAMGIFGHSPPAALVTVGIGSDGMCTELSRSAQHAIVDAVEVIACWLQKQSEDALVVMPTLPSPKSSSWS